MHVAARTENGSEVLEYLLKNGAGVNIKGPEASPVLHLAARSGNENVVKKLIEHGADIDAEVEASGYTGMSFNGLSGLHRCWRRMFETKCVGDNLKMLVTVLAISVT